MKADRTSSLFWLAVALMAVYGAIQLGVGRLQQPGSGFLSFLAGSFICLMALIVFFQSFLKGKGFQAKISTLWEGMNWRRPLVIGLLLVAYILALERIGYLLTTFSVLGGMFKGVENFPWWKTTLLSASGSVASFLLFDTILKAPLPKGIFGF
ncbi:MAG: tripartite tricarboxylate transporter TctB family protein [Deltaproteobacteria bacterium]|nr:tripartite tricarboxylate transporter TctB family protein [Deltaproteobacteria bacterium]